ncbi:pyridoxal reductase [Schizosaccharomyces cryophilus OY26]|uniref:Pyridoxal reductase n=1 Tax=Schizosaccharomyces cryophilus (strain OY26 / ATCC MYA-4695 / CBS 11777 / NBRC 106824 / NRRL Y48691) TaxID=653667 RepID=S9XGC3_SCHCR|nr:pyridoxal reductase [Schizosaccharomyces cryophilus OY26]EPY52721.1 pyridoxal reductase [Schizosaccharomyces cryophilus OY26]
MPYINYFLVGPIGLGLRKLVQREIPISDQEAFGCMNNALLHGSNLWDAGEVFSSSLSSGTLGLLSRYFRKYPENIERVFLTVTVGKIEDSDTEAFLNSLKEITSALRGLKKIDLLNCQVVEDAPMTEEFIKIMNDFVNKGVVRCIGLWEPSLEVIQRVRDIANISAVRVEYSLLSRDIEVNGIKALCHNLGIPIIATAPLLHGILTGDSKIMEELKNKEKHILSNNEDREAVRMILSKVSSLDSFAIRNDMTLTEVALSFILGTGKAGIIPIPCSDTLDYVGENLGAFSKVLSFEQLDELYDIVQQ